MNTPKLGDRQVSWDRFEVALSVVRLGVICTFGVFNASRYLHLVWLDIVHVNAFVSLNFFKNYKRILRPLRSQVLQRFDVFIRISYSLFVFEVNYLRQRVVVNWRPCFFSNFLSNGLVHFFCLRNECGRVQIVVKALRDMPICIQVLVLQLALHFHFQPGLRND